LIDLPMAMRAAPGFDHAKPGATGVLLINVGTPAAPTAKAVRSYLKTFLSDPRVIEHQGWKWKLVLYGAILRTRPKQSAAAYRHIWTEAGSPLLVVSQKQAELLQAALQKRLGGRVVVEVGMGYGAPSVDTALGKLWAAGCERLLVFPLYPQYAAATVGSALDAVTGSLKQTRWVRPFRFLSGYHDHPAYIAALAESLRDHWSRAPRAERLLLSFHGLPKSTLALGDPYFCHCHKTARLLWDLLETPAQDRHLGFQSRFGKGEWLRPYANEVLEEWGRQGVGTVDVICPGFATDCLETLEEIGDEYAGYFKAAGGRELRYVPALNLRPAHIEALAHIALSHLGDWAASDESTDLRAELAHRELQRGLNS
jgi:protoporphyrin/coproporphyrin ferrochelatase